MSCWTSLLNMQISRARELPSHKARWRHAHLAPLRPYIVAEVFSLPICWHSFSLCSISNFINRVGEQHMQHGTQPSLFDHNPASHAFAPSEKQLRFARSIAAKTGATLPWEVQHDRASLSRWISRHQPKRVQNQYSHFRPANRSIWPNACHAQSAAQSRQNASAARTCCRVGLMPTSNAARAGQRFISAATARPDRTVHPAPG